MPGNAIRPIEDEIAWGDRRSTYPASAEILPLHRKATGAYYTPDDVAAALARWVVRSDADRLVDPACGDGRFIAHHANSVGIDQDVAAACLAAERARSATIVHAEFFEWAATTRERFDCAAGNPPFIRYQRFKGKVREQALSLCAKFGAAFSGLTSSWAPFLVATASLLRPGGRMAFVVPAEIGHAPYAAPLLDYLVDHFSVVHVIAIREKLFPDLSEDCWLLFADKFGDRAASIGFSALKRFEPAARPPRPQTTMSVREWRTAWSRRLRPLLLPERARAAYQAAATSPNIRRLRDLASVGIGYVSGANQFFHLKPSQSEKLGLPISLLQPTVRNGRILTSDILTSADIREWGRSDHPFLLLKIPPDIAALPPSVVEYLNTTQAGKVRRGYKCQHRKPWYSVPDVHIPDFFLTYLSGLTPRLVLNEAQVTCTNALHYVRLKDPRLAAKMSAAWGDLLTQLSCEIEGHPLGGGVLKLEPREAGSVLLRLQSIKGIIQDNEMQDSIAVMRSWRHYCQP